MVNKNIIKDMMKNTKECKYYDYHGCKKIKRSDIVCDHDKCKFYTPKR